MANLNVEAFSDEYKDVAPKECSLYLYECFDEETKKKIKDDWNKIGGYKTIPWWKWIMENVNVSYCQKEDK